MKVGVVTATKRYGGLDVTYGALLRQTYRDFLWIVADELYHERQQVFREEVKAIEACHFQPEHKAGYYSNLPGIYNAMLEVAESFECDLVVSLQDYIWVPPHGLQEFVSLAEKQPNALLTGLCSMLAEPPSTAVENPEGLWTIFRDAYEGPRPDAFIAWDDVRAKMNPHGVSRCSVQHWEMNWAAIPLGDTLRFDEKYGKHIGHENQQFAAQWIRSGRSIGIDTDNHAYSLPHRHYFEEEWADQEWHRGINATLFESEYGE